MSYFLTCRNIALRPMWRPWGSMGCNTTHPLRVVGLRFVTTKLPLVQFLEFGLR